MGFFSSRGPSPPKAKREGPPPVKRTKKVLVVGGSCGATMLTAAQMIEDACWERKIRVNVRAHNVWESDYPDGEFDLIVELFKTLKDKNCPVLEGKPFINHEGEQELVAEIVNILNDG